MFFSYLSAQLIHIFFLVTILYVQKKCEKTTYVHNIKSFVTIKKPPLLGDNKQVHNI